MRKMKKIMCLLAVFVLVISCVGCMRMDIGAEFKEDGNSSLTTKLSLAESVYEALISSEGDLTDENGEVLDLNEFEKETIDDKTYYSYKKTEEYDTYQELVDALKKMEATDEAPFFQDVKIATNKKDGYDFTVITSVMENEEISMSDDWLTITMTVKMSGKITNTNGEVMEDGSVRFVMNDFADNTAYFVYTEAESSMVGIVMIMFVSAAVLVTVLVIRAKRKKKYNVE